MRAPLLAARVVAERPAPHGPAEIVSPTRRSDPMTRSLPHRILVAVAAALVCLATFGGTVGADHHRDPAPALAPGLIDVSARTHPLPTSSPHEAGSIWPSMTRWARLAITSGTRSRTIGGRLRPTFERIPVCSTNA